MASVSTIHPIPWREFGKSPSTPLVRIFLKGDICSHGLNQSCNPLRGSADTSSASLTMWYYLIPWLQCYARSPLRSSGKFHQSQLDESLDAVLPRFTVLIIPYGPLRGPQTYDLQTSETRLTRLTAPRAISSNGAYQHHTFCACTASTES
jgi:hypothetical protein